VRSTLLKSMAGFEGNELAALGQVRTGGESVTVFGNGSPGTWVECWQFRWFVGRVSVQWRESLLRILLADDHERVRKVLRMILEAHAGWQVCGVASNGREAVSLTVKLKPDVAVLDLEMPELNGLEATRQIKEESPEVEVLICSMHDSDEFRRAAFEAGARGYVGKSDAGQYLMEAAEALSRHQAFFARHPRHGPLQE